MNAAMVENIVRQIILQNGGTVVGGENAPEEKKAEDGAIPVGVSNRHIHLTASDVEVLFGKGYELTPMKDLSQPGQFACKETLTLVGPSMRPIEKVRVLGPLRSKTQVEISRTDSFTLKVKAPVRESGDVAGSAPIAIVGPKGILTIKEGCIIANRHIHMSPADAAQFGVKDGDTVTVDADTERRTRFFDVQVRVSDKFRLEMHLDTDDANAAALGNGSVVHIHQCRCSGSCAK
ncbi:MAG: phosphate propanoyltransferase [Firmicutes bacterium]|nr:phosphate propanoyltransferase [Bacillota bacterium]